MSQNSISNSLLNVVLVLAESAITLVLRFDPNLRKAVYPLAQKTLWCVCAAIYPTPNSMPPLLPKAFC
nr:hypothetical protein [Psychrobacter sp. PraFG1]UNK04698.1 hypothetical protein MN210_10795 [Psychrobacter sp. PraFG1]